MYVVSSKKDDRLNGQIANALMQVTAEPKIIAVCINRQNLTHEFIEESKVFSVSILSTETSMQFIGHFGFKSGRDIDKFKDMNYKIDVTGAPIPLDYAIAYLEAEVINSLDIETHTIFIGRVLNAEVLNENEPMTYKYYHEVKRGKSPKTAPTFLKE